MTTLFAAFALVLGIARLVLLIALHRAESDHNAVEHAVGDHAVGPTRTLGTVRVFLSVLAAIFVVLPFLPTDVPTTLRRTQSVMPSS